MIITVSLRRMLNNKSYFGNLLYNHQWVFTLFLLSDLGWESEHLRQHDQVGIAVTDKISQSLHALSHACILHACTAPPSASLSHTHAHLTPLLRPKICCHRRVKKYLHVEEERVAANRKRQVMHVGSHIQKNEYFIIGVYCFHKLLRLPLLIENRW